jgi:hypothetical protein
LLLADRKYKTASSGSAGDDDDDDDDAANANNARDDIPYNHVSDYAPFFEIDARWQQQESPDKAIRGSKDRDSSCRSVLADSVQKNHARLGRRVFNTHLRWDMLPKKREQTKDGSTSHDGNFDKEEEERRPQCGKFIYITRNQIDVVSSFYHHLSNQKEGTYTDTFDTFARDWMQGKIPFGSSLDHLISFAEGFANNSYDTSTTSTSNGSRSNSTSSPQPLLLLSYEQLKSNLHTGIHRIISFLNLIHIPTHVLNEELLPSFEFNSMKNNIHKFQPKSVGWLNGFQFLRRGVVGDGRRLMLLLNDDYDNDDESENHDTNGDEGGGESSELMNAYHAWVEREEYCSKITNLFKDECYVECREVFLSVV